MATPIMKRNMRLFGLPYQFLPSVDPRVPDISEVLGRKFAENIILDAPVITMIPGKPKYLPAEKDKQTTTNAIIMGASGDFSALKQKINDTVSEGDTFRFYDFSKDYAEYVKYVNILCRTCAGFLEIKETIDGETCQRYDYSKYRWTTEIKDSAVKNIFNHIGAKANKFRNSITGKGKETNVGYSDIAQSSQGGSTEVLYETSISEDDDSFDNIMATTNYVQFFVDPDVSMNENFSNNTSESQIKGMLDQSGNVLKEIAFAVNSGGLDQEAFSEFADSSMQALADTISGVSGDNNALSGVLSRVLSLSSNVAKGENVIMPDIYQSSSYDKSYSFAVHLKTPYGTKFGYFMDICVPLMHLLALGIPKQTTANTYGSPFLVKAYCEGIFTCNMGMVTGIQISKGINSAFSADGLPTEVDVQITLTDLYSDISMSPESSPVLFINNSSLIEYLATTCGMSLITPNLQSKFDMIVDTVVGSFVDIDNNIFGAINNAVDQLVMDFFGLVS